MLLPQFQPWVQQLPTCHVLMSLVESLAKFGGRWDGSALNTLLKGSWDLVTRVIIMVTILITTYNPN